LISITPGLTAISQIARRWTVSLKRFGAGWSSTRGYLRDGVQENLAIEYMRRIIEDTAEPARVEVKEQLLVRFAGLRDPHRDR
jgi:hypothetical protein